MSASPRQIVVKGSDCPAPLNPDWVDIKGEESFDSPHNVNAFMFNFDSLKAHIQGLENSNKCLRKQVGGIQ